MKKASSLPFFKLIDKVNTKHLFPDYTINQTSQCMQMVNHCHEVLLEWRSFKRFCCTVNLSRSICHDEYHSNDLLRIARSVLPKDQRIIGSAKKSTMISRGEDAKFEKKILWQKKFNVKCRTMIEKYPLGT